jgi:hypothetical protein
MRNLNSTKEGIWVEIIPAVFTETQKLLLMSKELTDREAKATLITELRIASEVTPDELTLALAIAKYNCLKPVVSENETYELIGCIMSIRDTITTGIINYKVNGSHKQIRF